MRSNTNKRVFALTKEQWEFLNKILNKELDEEYINPASDGGAYYEATLDVYKAIQPKPMNFIEAYALKDDLENREKELAEIKENNPLD